MKIQCASCGRTLDTNIRARYYPEDDTHLCELCFPFENLRREPLAEDSRERPASRGRLYAFGSSGGK